VTVIVGKQQQEAQRIPGAWAVSISVEHGPPTETDSTPIRFGRAEAVELARLLNGLRQQPSGELNCAAETGSAYVFQFAGSAEPTGTDPRSARRGGAASNRSAPRPRGRARPTQ
jgi:hypothetical protein